MKEINRELLNARMQDMNVKVSDAMRLERIAEQGETPESVDSKVRSFLGLDKSESLVANAQDRASKINVMASTLTQLNGVRKKINELGLGISEDESLAKVEEVLANKIMALYDISEEDLYE